MSNKELAQKNYDMGLWTIEMLNNLVTKGVLTEQDVIEIVGG